MIRSTARNMVNRETIMDHVTFESKRKFLELPVLRHLILKMTTITLAMMPIAHARDHNGHVRSWWCGAVSLVICWRFLERLPLLTIMTKDDQRHVLALDQI